MHKRLASEMACFAICQLGWTTPLINDWATISLYPDKGDLSFSRRKKEFLMLYTLYFKNKCTSLKAESLFDIKVRI